MGTSEKESEIMQDSVKKALYARWLRLRYKPCSLEFQDFTTFYWWAIAAGFANGASLVRNDNKLPYSPENCYWVKSKRGPSGTQADRMAKKWNETVNRIRKFYGMPPVEEMKGEVEDGNESEQKRILG